MPAPHASTVDGTRTVTVVADDLTGATDTVVQFRQSGWTSYLLLSDRIPGEKEAADLVAVSRSLDTRPLTAREAEQITQVAVSEQIEAQADRLYLKIDSTMRGSVAGQVAGALRAWRSRHPEPVAVICPAYPQMGRVIVDGHMRVNGVPLDQSPAGFDPVTPVRTSALAELVPGAVRVGNGGTAEELAGVITAAAATSDRVVVDAADDADLRRLAEAVAIVGTRAVCVGSAGLARHLAEVWRPSASSLPVPDPGDGSSGTVVICVSSLNEVSLGQVDHLRTALGEVATRREFAAPELAQRSLMRSTGAELRSPAGSAARVLVLQPSPDRIPGMSADEGARLVARGLAAGVSGLLTSGGVGTLILVGGDGAQAVLQELGATAIRIDRQVSEGVPLGRIVGGRAEGLQVITKAGGFGTEATLTELTLDIIHAERRT